MSDALFDRMRFRHPWRSYQARILDEMATHLDDDKLHIVAAPGAGKTVLGLEIIRRLRQRCLILAPSLLVRDQWIERLRHDFLGQDLLGHEPPRAAQAEISTDLRADAVLRVATYQALHQMRGETLPEIGLLCLDEAHHLRKSWWQTLTGLARAHGCTTLSLTATPPFDAAAHEWQNYDALCGRIDAEISAPELVASGDLCPHQDLVHTAITSSAADYSQNRQDERALFQRLRADPELLAHLDTLPWLRDCKRHADAILAQAELFSAMLIYRHDAGCALPDYARRLLQIRTTDLPPLDWPWLETLFAGIKRDLPPALVDTLARAGGLHNDRLQLPPQKFTRRAEILRDDAARLRACLDIHHMERAIRGDGLRQAILVDRIGQTALKSGDAAQGFNAARVFRAVLEERARDDIAILTGQAIVLPQALAQALAGSALPDFPRYKLIAPQEADQALALANAAFGRGALRLIIGTQAFLGQGWDAPALNSLVLGTNLSRFVAVNQLRGRALRIDKTQPAKTANIWHLAILPDETVSGEDLAALEKRFSCFARIDRAAGEIRSYFAPEALASPQNAKARALAESHDTLAQDWRGALRCDDGQIGGRLMQESRMTWARSQLVLPKRHSLRGWWHALGGRLTGAPLPEADARQVLMRLGRVVAESLRQNGDLRDAAQIMPYVETGPEGLRLGLEHASRFEEGLFHDCLRQMLDPVETPRYLIHLPAGLLHRRAQSFAVPKRFDANKARAELFWRNWQAMIGRGHLIYTRTITGRGLLQSARLRTAGDAMIQNLQWR